MWVTQRRNRVILLTIFLLTCLIVLYVLMSFSMFVRPCSIYTRKDCPALGTNAVRSSLAPPFTEHSTVASQDSLKSHSVDSFMAFAPASTLPAAVPRPTVCSSAPQYLAIYVHSAPPNTLRRSLIRETWGSRQVLERLNATLVFIVGQSPDPRIADVVLKENQSYGDFVQGDFLDTYRNLSLKGRLVLQALTGLKWVSQHCQHARYLLKSDDDIFVDVFALVRHLMSSVDSQSGTAKAMLLCNYWDDKSQLIPRRFWKWAVSQSEYNQSLYPAYCQGTAYVMTPDLPAALLHESSRENFLWVDDVYVTGVLREAAGINATKLNDAYADRYSTPFSDITECLAKGAPLFVHNLQRKQFKALWEEVIRLEKVRQLQIQP